MNLIPEKQLLYLFLSLFVMCRFNYIFTPDLCSGNNI